ncbi:MAG: alpha/beta hydrolase [Acidobacteria bacterium]|nr:alpha/beta hydrolase [Acidobacteriota bacterium]
MPFFEHDGIRFHYQTAGGGTPLVFTHGLTGNLENARDLTGEMPGYRQVFWDARGHGRTSPAGPAGGFSFDVLARDLAALLDHLQIERAVVGGISMGAGISAKFAILNPDRVRALILVRPAWLTEPLPEGLELMPVAAAYMEQFGMEQGRERFVQSPGYLSLLASQPDTAAALSEQFVTEAAFERRGRLTGIPGDAPIRAWGEVEGLRIPALVIGCEPDYLHPLSFARAWAERLPCGRFAQVPAKSAGFELYAGAVRQHIAEFLSSHRRDPESVISPACR